MQFIDTNVFIYLLTGTPTGTAARVRSLFTQIEQGLIAAMTSESVIAEVVYVLSSKANFGLPRTVVSQSIRDILLIKGLEILNSDPIHAATLLYESTKLDWVDCMAVSQMKELGVFEIASFDRDFDRIQGIVRVEP